jgi:nitrogen fixation NifU-like protein
MSNDFENFGNELQKSIDTEARSIYSEKVIQYSSHPENMGRMNDPDGVAAVSGLCGDSIEIFLTVVDDRISDIRFATDGCGPTIACGVMATKLAKERTIKDAMKISPADIINGLDGLPERNLHCAILATMTLYKALADYLLRKEM